MFTNLYDLGLSKDIALQCTGKLEADIIQFFTATSDFARSKGVENPVEIMGYNYVKACKEGLVEIPAIIKLSGEKYVLFFLYDEKDVQEFKGKVELLKGWEYGKALFLSNVDPASVPEKGKGHVGYPLKKMFSLDRGAPPKGVYAMWWPTENEKEFEASKGGSLISSCYEYCLEYGTYILGMVLIELGLSPVETFQRFQFPETEKKLFLIGPEYKSLLLCISKEKGIRFLFHQPSCNVDYRDRLLHLIERAMFSYKLMFELKNAEKDHPQNEEARKWLNFIDTALTKTSGNGKMESLEGFIEKVF